MARSSVSRRRESSDIRRFVVPFGVEDESFFDEVRVDIFNALGAHGASLLGIAGETSLQTLRDIRCAAALLDGFTVMESGW